MTGDITCHDVPTMPSIGNGMKDIVAALLEDQRFSIKACKDTAAQAGVAIKRAKEEIQGFENKIAACRDSIAKQESYIRQANGAVKRLEAEAVNLEVLRDALFGMAETAP